MNKIKFLTLVALAVAAAAVTKALASEPVFIGARDSNYVISHSTVNVSSNTPVTVAGGTYGGLRISAVTGYRKVKIQFLPTALQDGVSVFYTLNGSTANIYTIGYVVRISTLANGFSPGAGLGASGLAGPGPTTENEVTVESSGQINFMLANGIAPVAARYMTIRLPN